MALVYEIDRDGFSTGRSYRSREEPSEGVVFDPPPATVAGQAALWTPEGWMIVAVAELDAQLVTRGWRRVRAVREALLYKSDWTQLADAGLSQNQRDQWAAYRQALRNIPQTFTDPWNIVWPEPPRANREPA